MIDLETARTVARAAGLDEDEIQIRAEDAATGETVEGAVRFQFEL